MNGAGERRAARVHRRLTRPGENVDIQPVNFRLGDVDTNVFDSNVLMLPVSKELVGIGSDEQADHLRGRHRQRHHRDDHRPRRSGRVRRGHSGVHHGRRALPATRAAPGSTTRSPAPHRSRRCCSTCTVAMASGPRCSTCRRARRCRPRHRQHLPRAAPRPAPAPVPGGLRRRDLPRALDLRPGQVLQSVDAVRRHRRSWPGSSHASKAVAETRPLVVGDGEPRGVAVAALGDHRLAEGALVGEPEPGRCAPRGLVEGVALPLVAAHPDDVEGVRRHQVHRLRRGSRPLQRARVGDVADLGRAVGVVDAQERRDADRGAVGEQDRERRPWPGWPGRLARWAANASRSANGPAACRSRSRRRVDAEGVVQARRRAPRPAARADRCGHVRVTGASGGPGDQSTGSPTGWPNSLRRRHAATG